jgi:hydroxyacylglutathione hydrolase
MLFRQIFDPTLAQYGYLIGCQRTGEALIVDPERDIDRYVDAAAAEGLTITAVAETHIHADFLSGARDLGEATGARVYLSDEGDADWKYGWPAASSADVRLVRDGDLFAVGQIRLQVLHTPGHTPEHVCFLVTDAGGGASEPMGMLSGDFLFVGDLGRPDLLESAAGKVGAMEPAAARLWESTKLLQPFADHLQIWPAHGAGSACGKALGAVPTSTLGYERRFNASLALAASGREAFVAGILEGQPEPPLYFGRMKVENRDGVPPARALGAVAEIEAARLATANPETVVVDTRRDREAYLAAHRRGSIWAPWGGADFLAIAGSYVLPEEEILLIGEPLAGPAMARALYRIGLDRVAGIASPAALDAALGDQVARIPSGDWETVRRRLDDPDVAVLDVRRAAEFAAGAVPGARNIAHTRLRARLDELDRDKTYLVHCRSGHRATAAAAFLESQGFDVTHIGAKIADWRQTTATKT